MHRTQTAGRFVAILAVVFLATASPAWAQLAGLTGVARDTTGGVLPGVTVETERTDGIETTRVAVTDGTGRYNIVSLQPGTYTVTFTLPGFSVFVNEGIELPGGFTGTANAAMEVGGLEETVTVSGESPLVDVVNSRAQQVLTREVFDSIPLGKGYAGLQAMTVGALGGLSNPTPGRDVGGVRGDSFSGALRVHGLRDGKLTFDGKPTSFRGGSSNLFHINYLGVQEVVVDIGGNTAETQYGGSSVRVLTKDGTNDLSGTVKVEYAPPGAQSENLDDDLRARGLSQVGGIRRLYDVGGSLGGAIVRDKAWFYTSHRLWEAQENLAGVFYNKLAASTLLYEEDLSRPGFTKAFDRDSQVKVTWQVSDRHKVTIHEVVQRNCGCFFGQSAGRAPEATYGHYFTGPWGGQHLLSSTWTFPATNRLLFEAKANFWLVYNDLPGVEGVADSDIAVFDNTEGRYYNSLFTTNHRTLNPSWVNTNGDKGDQGDTHQEFKVSYVTGTHALKVGFQSIQQRYHEASSGTPYTPPVMYEFTAGAPVGLTQLASPNFYNLRMTDLGFFAQDAWTIDRLTLNVGLRYDYSTSYAPAFTRPAGLFVAAIDFPSQSDFSNFHDITPRLGFAYDVFGTGQTAVKVNVAKTVVNEAMTRALALHPANALIGQARRTWVDTNGNLLPDCDLPTTTANGECGALSGAGFGTPTSITAYADDAQSGWGNRGYNWVYSVVVEQELTTGIGMSVGYYRTTNANVIVTDNLLLAPADYDEYSFTVPTDPRLPGGGGNVVSGNFDVKLAKFGLVDNLRVLSDNSQVYNGIDVLINAQFNNGATLQGGFNTGQTINDSCQTSPDFPPLFCRNVTPFKGQHNFKFYGQYPLPWYGLVTSASFLNLPGISQRALNTFTNADIVGSLGRNLASCPDLAPLPCSATIRPDLYQNGSEYESRQTQVDWRIALNINVGGARLQPRFEIYNLLNANDPQSISSAYGANWLNPAVILTARLIKFGMSIDF